MKTILSIFFILIFFIANAQSIKKADFLKSKGYYEEAIEIYLDKLQKTKKEDQKKHINSQLAYAYNELHNEEKAYKYFKEIPSKKRSKQDAYLGFQLLRSMEKYDLAHQLLLNNDSLKEEEHLLSISQWSIDKISETDGSYKLFNTNLETKGHSFGYSIDKDGLFYFSTLMHSQTSDYKTYFYDLYQYKIINDSSFNIKEKEKAIKDNKRIFYRGTPYISKENKFIYYTTNSSESFKYTKLNADKKAVSSEGENILKIFRYDVEESSFESLPINNNNYHNCFPFIYNDSVLFYSSSKNIENKLDIFYIIKEGGQWSSPILLKNVNTFEDEVYPFIYNDKFYFSSRGREGFGGMDIYSGDLIYDTENGFSVSNIENLLQPINSSKDDFAYYQHKDNGGYISTNRDSKNGIDIVMYFSKSLGDSIDGVVIDSKTKKEIPGVIYKLYVKQNNKWQEISIENLGDPAQYFSLVDPNKNYKITFEREGYYGEEVQIPNNKFEDLRNEIKEFIKVIELEPKNQKPLVYDILTNLPISDAKVTLKSKDGNTLAEKTTDKNGSWEHDFNNEDIEIDVLKDGYEDLHINMDDWSNPNSRSYLKSGMTPLHNSGDIMTINNIYFEFDSSKIRPESYKILNNIVKFMNRYPEVKFELGAHTDCVGPNEYNEKLSQRRAHSCWKYLISAGISKDRMIPKGYGERVPLHPCSEQRKDDEKALLNRRIEMTIL